MGTGLPGSWADHARDLVVDPDVDGVHAVGPTGGTRHPHTRRKAIGMVDTSSQAPPPAGAERPIGELVGEASAQMSRLVRDEIQLAVAELQEKGKRGGIGAGLFGAAGITALFGVATLLATAVLALALVLPGWAAALIVAVVVLAVAGVLALMGRKKLQSATPVVPEDTVGNVRADIDAVKEGLHR